MRVRLKFSIFWLFNILQIILTHPLIKKFNPITVMVTVKIKSTQLNLLLYEKIS